jgi:hypothetical protein
VSRPGRSPGADRPRPKAPPTCSALSPRGPNLPAHFRAAVLALVASALAGSGPRPGSSAETAEARTGVPWSAASRPGRASPGRRPVRACRRRRTAAPCQPRHRRRAPGHALSGRPRSRPLG